MKKQYAIRMIANAIYINGRRSGSSWNPALSTPSALTLSVISDTQIDGTFTINGSGQDGHKVYISSDGGATYTLNQTLTGADNTFEATGLTAGTLYYFYVKAYKGSQESPASDVVSGTTYQNLYVRPLGGSYGTENGTSYDNSFDGFAGINWASVTANTILWICGTHNELLSMGASGTAAQHIRVRGDYSGDNGIIDGENTLAMCIGTNSKNYIEFHYITAKNATTNVVGSGGAVYIWHYNCTYSNSGDQVTESNGGVTVVYTDCVIEGGVDDGFSMHSGANVIIKGCIVRNCDTGIQSSGGASLLIEDSTFDDNTSGDISIDFNGTIINRCKFLHKPHVNVPNGIVAYSLFLSDGAGSTFLAAAAVTVINCTFIGNGITGQIYSPNAVTQEFKNCIFYDISVIRGDIGLSTIIGRNCCAYSIGAAIWDVSENIITVDPKFTNLAGGDYTLAGDSPCIGIGITGLGYTSDIDGNPVPLTGVDIGCYQSS